MGNRQGLIPTQARSSDLKRRVCWERRCRKSSTGSITGSTGSVWAGEQVKEFGEKKVMQIMESSKTKAEETALDEAGKREP